MKIIEQVADLRAEVRAWQMARERVAFVPTMGNLHAGHLALVERAGELCDRVVVSVFVNPLQFSEGEDFSNYPRTFEDDRRALSALSADLLFAPSVGELYPRAADEMTRVIVPGVSDELCGSHRAGHFEGVTTVVNLLLNLVQPQVAVFGEKDYQQLLIIRRMVDDLMMPVEIVGVPTAREASGLALSSRNRYLSADEQRCAPSLYRVLGHTADDLRHGGRDFAALELDGMTRLREAGMEPQYYAVRSPDLSAARQERDEFVVLAAVKLGATRLIDNIQVNLAKA